MKPWGGRFSQDTNEKVEAFSESVSIDHRLAEVDIRGSKAHARMLGAQGILAADEVQAIVDGLDAIAADIRNGDFVFDPKLEDVHMNIEVELTRRIGEAGKKLHTARSRNDQVATDFRLYVRGELERLDEALHGMTQALFTQSSAHVDTLLPGMTHLQHAQPISLGHHLLAYFEMFRRDADRVQDCARRLNVSPLGSAALAGTPHPIDRFMTAEELGFAGPCRNSLDGVSDRDFACEAIFDCSLIMMHLSRLAEETILWNSQEFQFVELPDDYCTGSSIMPQKKNPDVPELVRGKVGCAYGNLMNMLTTMKGLPLAYNRDMQEDKRPVMETLDTTLASLELMAGLVAGMKFRDEALTAALGRGFITATDVADYLVGKGVAFRDAHRISGEMVAWLQERGRTIESLTLDEFRQFDDHFDVDVLDQVSSAGSVDRRESFGGTARANVRQALSEAGSWLEQTAR